MANNEEEQAADVAIHNQEFIDAISAAGDGHCKNASAAGSNMIRRRIRENGFLRNIIKPKPVTDADLDRALEGEQMRIIEDMEADSVAAKTIPFNGAPDTAPYRGNRFETKFSKITTPEFTKNVDELRTYRMDLRQVTTDNALKDMHTEEDSRFIKTCDRIVGPVGGVGESGLEQNVEIAGQITRSTYPTIKRHLQDFDLNNGVFLMNWNTLIEFEKWGRDEMGGDTAEKVALSGLKGAMVKFEFFSVPHIATIKRLLVPDNVVYQFAEPGYLGRFYILEETTMFVDRKKDILRFSAHEKIGVSVANVRGVRRTKFVG